MQQKKFIFFEKFPFRALLEATGRASHAPPENGV